MTNPVPHKTVALILIEDYAKELPNLAKRACIWIAGTPQNKTAVEQLWAAGKKNEVTWFRPLGKNIFETIEISIEDIETHFGPYTYNPPYQTLEVIGAALSKEIEAVLTEYGFREVKSTVNGFTADKKTGD